MNISFNKEKKINKKKPIIIKDMCFLNNIVLSLYILFEANPKVDR